MSMLLHYFCCQNKASKPYLIVDKHIFVHKTFKNGVLLLLVFDCRSSLHQNMKNVTVKCHLEVELQCTIFQNGPKTGL
jgi:hypothetical protein